MENFKKYYKFPLHADDMGIYIRTANNEMALMFTIRLNNDIIQNIINKLNGKSDRKCIPAEWHIKNGTEVWFDETKVMIIRGWGMLHGIGNNCYRLPEEEAIKIQDEFAKYIIDTLNN